MRNNWRRVSSSFSVKNVLSNFRLMTKETSSGASAKLSLGWSSSPWTIWLLWTNSSLQKKMKKRSSQMGRSISKRQSTWIRSTGSWTPMMSISLSCFSSNRSSVWDLSISTLKSKTVKNSRFSLSVPIGTSICSKWDGNWRSPMLWRRVWSAWISIRPRSQSLVSCSRLFSESLKSATSNVLAAARSLEKSRRRFAVSPASSWLNWKTEKLLCDHCVVVQSSREDHKKSSLTPIHCKLWVESRTVMGWLVPLLIRRSSHSFGWLVLLLWMSSHNCSEPTIFLSWCNSVISVSCHQCLPHFPSSGGPTWGNNWSLLEISTSPILGV